MHGPSLRHPRDRSPGRTPHPGPRIAPHSAAAAKKQARRSALADSNRYGADNRNRHALDAARLCGNKAAIVRNKLRRKRVELER